MRILLAAPLAAVLVLGVSAPVAAGQQGQQPARHQPWPRPLRGRRLCPARAAAGGDRPGLLLRDGRPVRERRPGQRHRRPGGDPLVTGFDPTEEGLLQRR